MTSDTVLVTGGAGFIGQHLTIELLSQGRNVVVLDDFSTGSPLPNHPRLRVIEGDISDSSIRDVALNGVMSVINLAAIASVPLCESKPDLSSQVNHRAAEKLFQEASERGVSAIIHASTSALYGVPVELPLTEKSLLQPIGRYGIDKQRAETSLLSIENTPICALRLFNVFGPGQKKGSPYSGVLTIFSERMRNEEPLIIFGDGSQTRDFIHVFDVVSAFIACLNDLENKGLKSKVHGETFNVCSGKSLTLLDVIEAFSTACPSAPEVVFEQPRDGDILHSSGSNIALSQSIGWSPTEDFLQRLLELL